MPKKEFMRGLLFLSLERLDELNVYKIKMRREKGYDKIGKKNIQKMIIVFFLVVVIFLFIINFGFVINYFSKKITGYGTLEGMIDLFVGDFRFVNITSIRNTTYNF